MKNLFTNFCIFLGLYLVFMVPSWVSRQLVHDALVEQDNWKRYNLQLVNARPDTLSSSAAVIPSEDRSNQISNSLRQYDSEPVVESPIVPDPIASESRDHATPHENSDIALGVQHELLSGSSAKKTESRVAAVDDVDDALQDRAK